MIEKFLDALDDGKEFYFLANYYEHMTKMELKNILVEYIAALKHAERTDHAVVEAIIDDIRDTIQTELVFGKE